MSKIKVLWLSSWFPTPHSPLNGDFIERMGFAVSKYCDIYLLYVTEGPVRKIEVFKETITFPRIIVTVPYSAKKYKVIRFLNLLNGFKKGISLIQSNGFEPNLIHLHAMYPAGIFYLLFSFFRNRNLVITEHWSGFRKYNWGKLGIVTKLINNHLAKKATIITTVNQSLEKDMIKLGMKSNYEVVPNVVDCDLFYPKKAKKNRNFVFLHVSSLKDRIKNVRGIIQVFAKIAKQNNNVILRIVGDGNERNNHESLVEQLGIGHTVTFTGNLKHNLVSKEMNNADCLVHFSNFENLPCVILEAMATGLPIIATETGGMKEWVDKSSGFLVKPKDESALLESMYLVIENKEKFKVNVIREKILRKCSPDIIGSQILNIYKQAMINDQ